MTDKKAKILIVEDEKPLAKALTYKLLKSNFKVESVYDGQEGLDYIDKEDVDLVILDLMMPKMDGFTFLKKLKDMDKKVPVIVASNLGQKKDVEEAKALGAVDYIVKSDTPLSAIVDRIQLYLKD